MPQSFQAHPLAEGRCYIPGCRSSAGQGLLKHRKHSHVLCQQESICVCDFMPQIICKTTTPCNIPKAIILSNFCNSLYISTWRPNNYGKIRANLDPLLQIRWSVLNKTRKCPHQRIKHLSKKHNYIIIVSYSQKSIIPHTVQHTCFTLDSTVLLQKLALEQRPQNFQSVKHQAHQNRVCCSSNMPQQSLDLESPPTQCFTHEVQVHPTSLDPDLTRRQISGLKLSWVLASQQQPKQWYPGGKSPYRWDCTYLTKVTCQVTLRHFLCG